GRWSTRRAASCWWSRRFELLRLLQARCRAARKRDRIRRRAVQDRQEGIQRPWPLDAPARRRVDLYGSLRRREGRSRFRGVDAGRRGKARRAAPAGNLQPCGKTFLKARTATLS